MSSKKLLTLILCILAMCHFCDFIEVEGIDINKNLGRDDAEIKNQIVNEDGKIAAAKEIKPKIARQFKAKKLWKHVLPFAIGIMVIKALLFPLALKTMVLMSFVGMVMSAASMVVTAMVNSLSNVILPKRRNFLYYGKNGTWVPHNETITIESNDRHNGPFPEEYGFGEDYKIQ